MNIRPSVTINGINSNTITGLLITSLPPISKPQKRTLIETIDGRSGDLVTPLGYSAYDKPVGIALTSGYDVDEIIKFFNSEGVVIFSNEPTKYYNFAIYEQIDLERLIRFKTATVLFHTQPYKYSVTETPLTFNTSSGSSVTVKNNGNTDSKPNLMILGEGEAEITLNNKRLLDVNFDEAGGGVYIDTKTLNAYGVKDTLRNVKASIVPYQNLNGQDAPYPAGAGKNLVYDIIQGVNIDGSGKIVTATGLYSLACARVKANTTYTATTSEGQLVAGFFTNPPAINSVSYNDTRLVQNSKTFTADIDGYMVFRMSPDYTTPQLELGSSATDFSPISNICPIACYSEINVTRAGKNLFIQDNPYISAGSGVDFVINSDKSITLSGTATANAFLILFTGKIFSSGTYTMKKTGNANIKAQLRYNNISEANVFDAGTTDQTGTINGGLYAGLIRIASGTNCNGVTLYPQLEVGSISSDYMPYNAENYNINLGVNQFDEVTELGRLDFDKNSQTWGQNVDADNAIRSTNYIPVMPNTQYYGFISINKSIYSIFYDANKNPVLYDGEGYKGIKNTVFTTPANACYMRFYVVDTTEYNFNLSINYPATITEYRAYTGSGVVYAGELNLNTGLLTITHKSVDLGSLTWSERGTSTSGIYRMRAPLTSKPVSNSQVFNAFCDAYKVESANDTYSLLTGVSGDENGAFIWAYNPLYNTATSASDFKASVTGYNLVYPLQEAIEIELTPVQVKTLLGVNSVYSDVINGDITATYKQAGELVTVTSPIVTFTATLNDLEVDKDFFVNRFVAGNYDNIRLTEGNNSIGVTGDIKQIVIDKYSRWL